MKKVVYTVVTKGFSLPEQRADFKSDACDFLCFTDDPDLKSDWWDIVPLSMRGLDAHRESRRPKILPHKYLLGYEFSLYIDSSIVFKVNPEVLFEKYLNSSRESFFCFPHPTGCLYKEAENVILLGYDDEKTVREQVDCYRRHGYPDNSGLMTGGVLLRRHNDPDLILVSEQWFEHVLRFSKRDQISFDFVAAFNHFNYGLLEGSIVDNKYVEWVRGDVRRVPADFDIEAFYKKSAPGEKFSAVSSLYFKRNPSLLNVIANRYKTDKGDIYFNAQGYAPVYEIYLKGLRNRKIKFLEIGLLRHDVQAVSDTALDQAPSLSMWKDYLPEAEIHGFDIADFSKYESPQNVFVHRGDMGNIEDLHCLLDRTGVPFDVIIDDASHASHHQQIAFGVLFPYLKPGGFYFIENLNYQPSSLERAGDFKTLDILYRLSQKKPVYSNYIDKNLMLSIARDIEYIHFFDSQDRSSGVPFRDSIAVIKKKGRAKIPTI